ncbi:MBL fold metallo-hydrolase [Roseomonas elaeocarpi]|uniref:MBL fold metallo-hydrolase n=1 Tax=Roseomonas elaeocarpi TaxID=907779 RepID=A0ABV6JXU2_9PROT
MQVTILGCGSSGGVPLIGGADGQGEWGRCDPREPRNRRSRSSIAVEAPDGRRLLVDAGPDLREQLLACGIASVDAILLTHAHADHVMGLDDVRQLNRLQGHAIPCLGAEATLADVQRRFDYAFREPTPGFFRPALTPTTVRSTDRLEILGVDIQLFPQDHKVTETLGLRIGDFAYSTDVVAFSEQSLEQLHGLDTWVVGCFSRSPHPVHAHVEMVAGWVERLRPRRTVLTHMGTDLDWAWMAANLPDGIEAAHDGMRLLCP